MNNEAHRLVSAHVPRITNSRRMLEPAALSARLVTLLEDAARGAGITPERLNQHAETVAYAIVCSVALRNGLRPSTADELPAPRPGHGRRVEDNVNDRVTGKGEA